HEKLTARDGRLYALNACGVRARGDKEIRIGSRVERGLEFGEHLLDRNDLLAGEVAATVWEDLIADEKSGDACGLKGADHLAHIVDAAKSGIGVRIDWNLYRRANARVMVGVVAHVRLAHVRLGEQAADRGVTTRDDRLKSLSLDDPCGEGIVGARHQHE